MQAKTSQHHDHPQRYQHKRYQPHTSSLGFTLIELAIVLTIMGLLLGSLAIPLSKRLSEQKYQETQVSLEKAMESLIGFALIHGRLPCPDINTQATAGDDRDGFEDINTNINESANVIGCAVGADSYTHASGTSVSWGDLPWQTLGISPPNHADAWNNRLRYAVSTKLALSGTHHPSPLQSYLASAPSLDLRCGNPANSSNYAPVPGCLPSTSGQSANHYQIGNQVIVVIYSHGANAWGASSVQDLTYKPFNVYGQTISLDQAANMPESKGNTSLVNQFVTRIRTDASSQAGEFDDVLIFMSAYTLAAKLLSAGLYP